MTQKPSRWLKLYHILVLLKPKRSLLFIFLLIASIGYFAQDFRMDASSDSLTLEHDDDLQYYQKVSERYKTSEFLFITYTPKQELFSEASLSTLKKLRGELESLERVDSVVTLLDVPLLKNPPGPLSDLSKNIKTLEENADIRMAKAEFSESPIYQNLLVSPDLRSTAIQVNFLVDPEHQKILKRRSELKVKSYESELTEVESLELETLEQRHRLYKDLIRDDRHNDISKIRGLIAGYQDSADLFIGGVPMIIDDILSFIRGDLVYFGIGMILFLILVLSIIFKGKRWVFLPMLCCLSSALAMVGLLGLMQWDITVVSSNFISLQLIFTMSLSIHIVVRYRELLKTEPDKENFRLVSEAVRLTFVPCAYASLTTIAGFTSLVVCDILPVVNFGYMMTMGLIISLIVTFWVIPGFLMLLGKPQLKKENDFGLPLTRFLGKLTELHGGGILIVSGLFVVLTAVGVSKLEVENSFIDYFKESTDIYQGMKFIDDELGGTTPLDLMLEFPSAEDNTSNEVVEEEAGEEDEDFAEFDEFENDVKDKKKYWFTQSKFQLINSVHDYLSGLPASGKVLSLATLEKTVRDLNGGQPLDNFTLALLFGEMPDSSKEILVDPYVSLDNNQARFSIRIRDSLEGLRRNQLIQKIEKDLQEKFAIPEERFRLTGLMVLYNNMLQSLFNSQIKTIGFTVLALLFMFLLLFRSLTVALIAIFPSLLSALSALGVMGLLGIPLDIMTITIVAIGIGIAVDDTIHYIHRYKAELAADGDPVKAMYRSHHSIGNAMYYTSLTITVGFSLLAISNFIPTILFGLLTALVMVIALVASLSLLPRLLIIFKPFK